MRDVLARAGRPAWRSERQAGGAAVALFAAAVLAGCASTAVPDRAPIGSPPQRDGAEAQPPAGLSAVPDAEPHWEPIHAGGANQPYEVAGRAYVPITQDAVFSQRGLASWYGTRFHGRRTSSGEVYDMYAMTAAHPTLPIPSYARVRNPANGREIVVRVNDRGPFKSERIVDLSYTAAWKLDLLRGVAPVELERITFEAIRTGAWRRGGAAAAVRAAVASAPAGASASAGAGAGGGAGTPPDDTSLVDAGSARPDVATDTATRTAAPAAAAPPAAAPPAPGPAAPGPAAAATIGVSTTLVAPVVASPPPAIDDAPSARAHTRPARGFWVQLGAFRQHGGALTLHRQVVAEVEWVAPLLAVFSDPGVFRLQAGPYPSRDAARAAAERIRDALRLAPAIVERR